ncbi:MAG: hypothetical protein E6J51_09855, partial [Chloroflexi bacterium]
MTVTGTSRSTRSSSSRSSHNTTSSPPRARGRARDFGIPVGFLPTGTHNAITDVAGVRVGHKTVWKGDYSPTHSQIAPSPSGGGRGGGSEPVIRSGVTAIW